MRRLWRTLGVGLLLLVVAGFGGCQNREPWSTRDTPLEADGQPTPEENLTPQQRAALDSAQQAKEAGEYDTALNLFREILAENPMITSAYLGIGDIYMIQEDYESAEPAYARAARLEPRNFDAQYGHGLALQMLGRFIDAVRAYHRALTIRPDSVNANLNMATTYLQMTEPGSALAFAEKAVELDPANGPARANLGAIYERLGRNAEAIEEYIVAVELMEESPPLILNLINVLLKEKRYREAINAAETLVRIEVNADAYERLGWAYFRLGEYENSLNAYQEAVNINPEYWQAYNGVGVNALNTWLLSKKRDRDAEQLAREAFRMSLRLNRDQQKVIMLMSNYGL